MIVHSFIYCSFYVLSVLRGRVKSVSHAPSYHLISEPLCHSYQPTQDIIPAERFYSNSELWLNPRFCRNKDMIRERRRTNGTSPRIIGMTKERPPATGDEGTGVRPQRNTVVLLLKAFHATATRRVSEQKVRREVNKATPQNWFHLSFACLSSER